MADNIVRDGLIGSLSAILSKRMGRRVQVHRIEQAKFVPGKPFSNAKTIRYTLVIEGCHPPAFYGMTCNEVKSRMAMISDLIQSGVLNVAANVDTARDDRENAHGPGAGSAAPSVASGEVPGNESGLHGDDQSSGDSDRY